MKRIFSILLIVIGINSCTTNKVASKSMIFSKQKFEPSLLKAKENDKVVFIDFWAAWCSPCILMNEKVLSDSRVVQFFNDNFINIKLDAESEDAILPKINYDVRSLPTFVWVDSDGNLLHTYKGTTTVENFLLQGQKALDINKSKK